jgi:hypothetical protein
MRSVTLESAGSVGLICSWASAGWQANAITATTASSNADFIIGILD